jgi:Glutathione-dependent formaldehyde-activating enzyme
MSDRVHVVGRSSNYVRVSDEGDEERTFHFCPDCGATVFYTTSDAPDVIAVPVGAFADPTFPPPTASVYESRRHPWVALPAAIETDEFWESLRPLYEAGEYAEVADRGHALITAHPEYAQLMYNVACCESLAGRTADAIEHLRRAIDRTELLRSLAAEDSDFDPIRDEPGFGELIG